MPSKRRFRRPVLSRLTWAWLSAAGVVAILGGVFIHAITTNEGPGRVALPVDDVEFVARVTAAAADENDRPDPPGSDGLRLAAPVLRDRLAAGGPENATAEGEDGIDILPYPDENDFFAENGDSPYSADDIVITIDGKQQNTASQVTLASLGTQQATPIPDPDPALLRTTPLGKVPRIAPDGRKALNIYAKPYERAPSTPRIAIIVGGLGLNSTLTERAIDDLPPEVSLAFAPYAKDLEFWTSKARRAGHEVLIELPMEGYGPNQQALGAAALTTSRTSQENLQRLDWLLSRFGGYFAATNYLGAKFSADDTALKPILQKLREAGVGYIDDTGAAESAGIATGANIASVNKMIPPAPDQQGREAVRRELEALEQIAKRNGAALGKTYAYAATLDEIAAWSASLDSKGYAQAPASSVLRRRPSSR